MIKVKGEPFVIEYNCRMGDPETEAVIPRLQNDLLQLLSAAAGGKLKDQKIAVDPLSCCTVVAVSGGYPGKIIEGKINTAWILLVAKTRSYFIQEQQAKTD